MSNGMPRLFHSRAGCRQGPSLSRTSSTANSGGLGRAAIRSDSALLIALKAEVSRVEVARLLQLLPICCYQPLARDWRLKLMRSFIGRNFGPLELQVVPKANSRFRISWSCRASRSCFLRRYGIRGVALGAIDRSLPSD